MLSQLLRNKLKVKHKPSFNQNICLQDAGKLVPAAASLLVVVVLPLGVVAPSVVEFVVVAVVLDLAGRLGLE